MSASSSASLAKKSVLWIGALALLNYWPVLTGRVPFPASLVTQFPPWEMVRGPDWKPPAHAEMGDLVTELYPWKAYTRRSIAAGTMPLWNPHLLLGAPFVGDLQTGLFYPPNLLYYVLPTPAAWSLSFLLRTILAGVFAALMARTFGASRTGSFLAGVVFAFCGWVTAFQTRPHLDAILWLPLVFVGVDRLARRPDGWSLSLTALAFALPLLAGQPESAAHVTLVGLVFFAYRLVLPPKDEARPGRLRFTAFFAGAGVLALLLAAVQMLPALEFIGQLDRTLDVPWGGRPLHEIAAFLSRDLGAHPNSAGVEIPECAAYAGMLTILLAPLALLHRNRRDAIFLALLVASVLQIAYGRGPVYWLSLHIPVLRGIPNWRLLGVADLALGVLAAMGLTALQKALAENTRRSLRWWILPGSALLVAGVGIALVRLRETPYPYPGGLVSLWTLRRPGASAAFLIGAAMVLALGLSGLFSDRRFATLAFAFTAVDLVSASYRFIPFAKPAEIFPPAPTFEFLGRDPGPHRSAPIAATYGPGTELMYGLDTPTGFTVILRRTTDLLAPLGFHPSAPGLTPRGVLSGNGRLLDLMNVKYLVATTWNRSAEALASRPDRFRLVFSDAGVRIFENRSVLPRAWLVPAAGIRAVRDEKKQLAEVCSAAFDPETSVILDEMPALPDDPGNGPTVSAVREIRCGSNDVRLHAAVSEASILMLSQSFYPGWRVFVDGREAALLRADYGFQAVALVPGDHDVRFVYRPDSLRYGAALSAAAILAGIVLCARSRRPAAG